MLIASGIGWEETGDTLHIYRFFQAIARGAAIVRAFFHFSVGPACRVRALGEDAIRAASRIPLSRAGKWCQRPKYLFPGPQDRAYARITTSGPSNSSSPRDSTRHALSSTIPGTPVTRRFRTQPTDSTNLPHSPPLAFRIRCGSSVTGCGVVSPVSRQGMGRPQDASTEGRRWRRSQTPQGSRLVRFRSLRATATIF